MDNIQNEKIIRLREVLNRTGLSRSMAYALIDQDAFPRPVSLGARAVGWRLSSIQDWIDRRVETPRHKDAS